MVRLADLLTNCFARQLSKSWVAPRVITDDHSGFVQCGDSALVRCCAFADQEEARPNVVLQEVIQQGFSDLRVGAVVKGESDEPTRGFGKAITAWESRNRRTILLDVEIGNRPSNATAGLCSIHMTCVVTPNENKITCG